MKETDKEKQLRLANLRIKNLEEVLRVVYQAPYIEDEIGAILYDLIAEALYPDSTEVEGGK